MALAGGRWEAPGLRLLFAAENLLDRAYREHASGVEAPGRGFMAGFEAPFR